MADATARKVSPDFSRTAMAGLKPIITVVSKQRSKGLTSAAHRRQALRSGPSFHSGFFGSISARPARLEKNRYCLGSKAGMPGPAGGGAEFLFDTQQAVVFRDPFAPARRACFDLPRLPLPRPGPRWSYPRFPPNGERPPPCSRLSGAIRMAAIVSERVPIWLSLIRIELPQRVSIPFCRRSVLVTNKSSPTSCTRSPSCAVRRCQPAQSSSSRASSMDRTGYWLLKAFQCSMSASAV